MAQLIIGGIIQVEGWQHKHEYIELAHFAVNEYNKKEHKHLKFVKITNVKSQVVEGVTYYITLEATDGKVTKGYEAKVWVKPWLHFKQLEDFKPLLTC